jgi:hypothetical protein
MPVPVEKIVIGGFGAYPFDLEVFHCSSPC